VTASGSFSASVFDVPSPARVYDYMLGGKNNFAADRAMVRTLLRRFPDALNLIRDNRLFLYRAVRFLARDAGIRQFLDVGSGLPAEDKAYQGNVYEVAQRYQPDARVVYVDNEPTVLTHGRARLAVDQNTTVVAADLTDPDQILADPETCCRLDLSQPLAVLLLSVGQFVTDDEALRRLLVAFRDAVAPGSYLAFSHLVGNDRPTAEAMTDVMHRHGIGPWRTRVREDLSGLLCGWEPVEPGLVDVGQWRPDPDQPPLPEPDESLRPFLANAGQRRCGHMYGGVVRKP
jgi:hypothetical protein